LAFDALIKDAFRKQCDFIVAWLVDRQGCYSPLDPVGGVGDVHAKDDVCIRWRAAFSVWFPDIRSGLWRE
jgi:hypothetical protein